MFWIQYKYNNLKISEEQVMKSVPFSVESVLVSATQQPFRVLNFNSNTNLHPLLNTHTHTRARAHARARARARKYTHPDWHIPESQKPSGTHICQLTLSNAWGFPLIWTWQQCRITLATDKNDCALVIYCWRLVTESKRRCNCVSWTVSRKYSFYGLASFLVLFFPPNNFLASGLLCLFVCLFFLCVCVLTLKHG